MRDEDPAAFGGVNNGRRGGVDVVKRGVITIIFQSLITTTADVTHCWTLGNTSESSGSFCIKS